MTSTNNFRPDFALFRWDYEGACRDPMTSTVFAEGSRFVIVIEQAPRRICDTAV
jgi:hypothetical protein